MSLEPQNGDAERRASTRFPLNLEVRYATFGGRVGNGRTIDVSAGVKGEPATPSWSQRFYSCRAVNEE